MPLFAIGTANFIASEKIKLYFLANPVDILKHGPSQEILHALTAYTKAKSGDDAMKAIIESR